MASIVLTPDSPLYPAGLRAALGDDALAALTALGDVGLLGRRTLALLCSVRCPGEAILGTYDLALALALALALRHAGVPVVGGFHAPMERECLRILLRGRSR